MYIIRKFVTTCGELSRTIRIRIRIRRYSLSKKIACRFPSPVPVPIISGEKVPEGRMRPERFAEGQSRRIAGGWG